MIWELKVTCVGGMYFREPCIRLLEIDSESSFYELHRAIQDAVGFANDHLYDFFAGRNGFNRKVIFADDEEWEDREDTFFSLTLEEVYPLPKSCKLYYLFDYGDDWLFEIKRSRKKPFLPVEGVEYPRVVDSDGPNPEQYPSYDDD
jgi:hypothetical protein